MNRNRGFTLIEVLVAFLIFAIIGVISGQLLSQTVSSREELAARGERLSQVHRAMQIMQRDFMQLIRRPIRDEYGDPQRALIIGSDGAIEFTRVGWRNPLKGPRSEVQRVGYTWLDEALIRGYWRHVDRAFDAEPVQQTLLEGVDRIEFYALDMNGNEHTFWPVPGVAPGDPSIRLAGVMVRIEVKPFGTIERIWEVPDV